MGDEIFIVIPAHNEEKTIAGVIDDLNKEGYQSIVVINDGSGDKTSAVANKEGVIVLNHVINRGQGAALKTGIDYALEQGAKYIVTFDADGQHSAKDIGNLLKPLKEKKVDVTLGSRFLGKKQDTPLVRKLFLKTGAFIIFIMYGIKLTDSHNGLRALSRRAAQKIDIKADDMEHASEILEEIKRKKLKYKEIPVKIIYTDYSKQRGQSTFNSFRILFKMVMRWLTR